MKDKYGAINTPIISSDTIRRELLGENLHKYDPRMLQVSKQAFALLRHKIELSMQFPLSLKNGLIVVDTTGINNDFRSDMLALAKEYNYNAAAIIFDYKGGIDEYMKGVPEEDNNSITKKIVGDHLLRLRTKALPKMEGKKYLGGVHKIRQKDFSDISISISNYAEYTDSLLPI
jgi:predicted kinase